MKRLGSPIRLFVTIAAGAFLCLPGAADDNARKPATPPPKKKGELEADEPPEKLPPDRSSSSEEIYAVTFPLLGTWEAGGRRLFIKQGGAYTLTGAETDAGFVRANLGRLQRRSNRQRQWIDGSYKFRSIDLIETDGAFGKVEWRRVR